MRQLHQLSINLLSQGMADLGLCGRMSAAAISQSVYSMFYPHSVGKQSTFLVWSEDSAMMCKPLHRAVHHHLLLVTTSLYLMATQEGLCWACMPWRICTIGRSLELVDAALREKTSCWADSTPLLWSRGDRQHSQYTQRLLAKEVMHMSAALDSCKCLPRVHLLCRCVSCHTK